MKLFKLHALLTLCSAIVAITYTDQSCTAEYKTKIYLLQQHLDYLNMIDESKLEAWQPAIIEKVKRAKIEEIKQLEKELLIKCVTQPADMSADNEKKDQSILNSTNNN